MAVRSQAYCLSIIVGAIVLAGCVPEQEKSPPLTNAQAWALSAAALLAERNFERHDMLGGRERAGEKLDMWRAGLVEGWGIGSRDDLIDTLRSLEEGGDRKTFEELGAHVTSLSRRKYKKLLKRSRDDTEKTHRIELAKEHYEKLGKKSLAGWDYCRYISLCRWGYLAGYFTEEEAWARTMPAALKLQKTFDSWEDLGQNYLIGREFWSYEDTLKNGNLYREAYQRLLDNPASPWNIYQWDMNIGDDRGEESGAPASS